MSIRIGFQPLDHLDIYFALFRVDVHNENILHGGDQVALLRPADLVELVRGVGEDILDGSDIAVDEVLIHLHPDELGIEKFALFELHLAALDGEDLGFQRHCGGWRAPCA